MEFPTEYIITLIIGCVLTWLIFILALAKFSKLCNSFDRFSKNASSDITGIVAGFKKTQAVLQETMIEQRRSNKLLVELIEVQKTNPLHGLEYELVEEEVEI